mmetsp:Transcript_54885/g.159395  ORF Transcript_54885/g.159395 Transcript_54885/m.159395 type:complete len:321 (-) Transcript_54885:141-1103(-)
MSVTGYMYNINATKKLGELELSAGLEGNRSWHNQFKHSAYVYIGGLHPGLTEGDVVIVFSQFGEIVDVNLIRDKSTGKSKGFCFICYEDQRSTILAVDNMNGFQLLKRTLRVDHVDKYKAPKNLDENEKDEEGDPKLLKYEATGAEGKGHGVYNVTSSQLKIDEVARGRKVVSSKAGVEDEDEAWAKAFEESLKAEGGDKKAKKKKDKKDKKDKKKSKEAKKEEKRQLKEMLAEAKRLKQEAKRAKEEAKRIKEERKKGGTGGRDTLADASGGGKPDAGKSTARGTAKGEPSCSSSTSSGSASEDSDDAPSERPKKRTKK